MTDHTRYCQAVVRFRTEVIGAFVPFRIGHDGLPSHLVKGNGQSRVSSGRGKRNSGPHLFRVAYTPLQNLHASNGSSDNSQNIFDSQMIHQSFLGFNHVSDRNYRKLKTVGQNGLRVYGAGAGGSHAAADNVGANHEIFIGINAFAGTDHVVPPTGFLVVRFIVTGHMGVTGQGVQNKNDIAFVLI